MYSFPSGPAAMHPQMRRVDYSHDIPPLGCNSDAMKLFVGNIPKSYTADSLRPLFESIGSVVELVVVRDKLTDESKGSAFVWYQTRAEAERAILELHLRRVLQDPTGEQDRPLVVRRANPKVPPVILPSTLMTQNSFPGGTHTEMDIPAQFQGVFPGTMTTTSRHSLDSQLNLGSGSPGQHINQMVQEQLGQLGLGSPGGPMLTTTTTATTTTDTEQLLNRLAKTQNLTPFLDQTMHCNHLGQPSQLFPALSSLSSGPPKTVTTTATNSSSNLSSVLASSLSACQNNAGGSLGFGQMTLALHVKRSQGSILGGNLHNIQGSSGALIQLTPGSGDSYVVLLSGNDSQLDAAKNMVQELVSQSALC
eukprot:g3907.t1